MSRRPTDITSASLHAYVDGQLGPLEAEAVAEWLRQQPEEAQAVLDWRSQRGALQGLHAELLDEPLPEALLRPLRRQRSAANAARWLRQGLAAAVLLSVGGLAGWSARSLQTAPAMQASAAPAFVRDAAIAHVLYQPEQRHPVEVSAAEQAHLVQWLGKRLGTPLALPDLGSAGFTLVGGRLLPAGQALGVQGVPGLARAMFMFESGAGERLTLYVSVRPPGEDAPAAFRFAQLPGSSTQSFYWLEGRLGYALSGQVPRERLAQLGGLVYAQLIKP
jgi:anti-sigma factor RsiW